MDMYPAKKLRFLFLKKKRRMAIEGPWYIKNCLMFYTYEFQLKTFDIFFFIVFRKIVPFTVYFNASFMPLSSALGIMKFIILAIS